MEVSPTTDGLPKPIDKTALFLLMEPKRKGGLDMERRDGWEKEREGLESRRKPHARLRVGEAIPRPQDTTVGCLFFFPACIALWNWELEV